jgi:uncharacterized membrane protein
VHCGADGAGRSGETTARLAAAESEPPKETAAVTQGHAEAGATDERRAGPDGSRLPQHPALLELAGERAQSVQNRIADRITAFAGSMWFVYIHIVWFGFGVESYPYGLLTMIVSLEAIFLSTFVMISQNRADAKRQALAAQQWQTVQEEDRQNEALLDLSREILELTKAIHASAVGSFEGERGSDVAAGSANVHRTSTKEESDEQHGDRTEGDALDRRYRRDARRVRSQDVLGPDDRSRTLRPVRRFVRARP